MNPKLSFDKHVHEIQLGRTINENTQKSSYLYIHNIQLKWYQRIT